MAKRKAPRGRPDTSAVVPQLGSTGLKQYGGYVREEFHRDLQGARGMKVYREMGDNSAEVGSSLAVIRLVATRAKWAVEPHSEDEQDRLIADHFKACMSDMAHSWEEFIRNAMDMIQFGFSPHEIVLKVRDGVSSKYDDGLIGWHSLPQRPPESLEKWDFAPNGDVLAMLQRNPTTNQVVRIPIEKLLNFRPRASKSNPEGVSVLRFVYFTYYWLKRHMENEGIGVERSLSGLPMIKIPAETMTEGSAQSSVFEMAKEIVQNIRNDADAGVVLPMAYQDGQPMYGFELLSASASGAPDTNKIIERLRRSITQGLGTDFMLLGHEGVGSNALGDSKTDWFELAVEGYLDLVAEPLNSVLVPLTLRLNGWDTNRCPKIKHEPLEKADLARLGDFIGKMVQVRGITPDDPLEDFLREQASLPKRDPNSKPRELPTATNTKPEGGGPDKGKPPESNPGGKREPMGYAGEGVFAGPAQPSFTIVNNIPKQPDVFVDAPMVTVEPPAVTVNPPDVFVEAPSVTVQPAEVRVDVPPSTILNNVNATMHAPEVQKIEVIKAPPPPETIVTVEERDNAGRPRRMRKKPVRE